MILIHGNTLGTCLCINGCYGADCSACECLDCLCDPGYNVNQNDECESLFLKFFHNVHIINSFFQRSKDFGFYWR